MANKRAEKIKKYAFRKKYEYKVSNNSLIKDFVDLELFNIYDDNALNNVIHLKDSCAGNIYIGEFVTKNNVRISSARTMTSHDSWYATEMSKISRTIGIIIDPNFLLPDFTMWPESIADKLKETVNVNKTEDIDFAEDKVFSDAWWLCSHNANVSVMNLFKNKSIRENTMKFVPKGYTLAASGSCLFMVSPKAIDPDHYDEFIKDLQFYHRLMTVSKEHYSKPELRQ